MNRKEFLRSAALLSLSAGIASSAFAGTTNKGISKFLNVADDYEDMKCKKILKSFDASLKDKDISEIMITVGRSFLDTEYVASTLDKNTNSEELVVMVTGLDCVTFVENCLAMSRCIKSGKTDFDNYKKELTLIRYRSGTIDGYPSRLHYFSDWLYDNDKKGLMKDITQEIGGIEYNKNINFMSNHPNSYKQLEKSRDYQDKIRSLENEINSRQLYYLPAAKLDNYYDKLQSGDIYGITTDIDGLDITHTGMIYKEDGVTRILHASLKYKKVLISDTDVKGYIMGNKKQNGLMIARPIWS
ncbi:hypothetical protein BH10BAC5_BH10BAC5_17800 [soil metagenome]